MRRKAGTLALPCVAALALVAAATATATESREQYAAQVDPICEAANAQSSKVFKAYARMLKKTTRARNPKLKRFNGSLARTLRRLDAIDARLNSRLAGVAAAPGDEALVAGWLALRRKLQAVNRRTTATTTRLLALITRGIPEGVGPHPGNKLKVLTKRLGRLTRELRRLSNLNNARVDELRAPACALERGAVQVIVG